MRLYKICLLHTEIFSKRRKIYSWLSKRLDDDSKWLDLKLFS